MVFFGDHMVGKFVKTLLIGIFEIKLKMRYIYFWDKTLLEFNF